MPVKLRLARHGKKKNPYYRLVAAPSGARRDGRFLEEIGTYDPLQSPPAVSLRRDRITHWLEHGARPTPTMQRLLNRFFEGEDTVRKPAPRATPSAAPAPAAEAAPASAEAAPEPAVEAAPTPAAETPPEPAAEAAPEPTANKTEA